jgi:hypothetical protein
VLLCWKLYSKLTSGLWITQTQVIHARMCNVSKTRRNLNLYVYISTYTKQKYLIRTIILWGKKERKRGKIVAIQTTLSKRGKGNNAYIYLQCFSKLTYPMLQVYTCNQLCDAGQQHYLEAKEFTECLIAPIKGINDG